ncbi:MULTISPECIES: hypothetical protein [Flagellimonas]|uniref:Uncharacterized protein n=1 Tax=Flagellimonas hadalis TaxID=2597517 RepID=A0A5N5IZI4_9FLAO|nr:hypothetical protein [Allomuricauda hadalis]KAB5492128.1 hypothetical protein FOT42_004040 [Allomuricauda hadalis]
MNKVGIKSSRKRIKIVLGYAWWTMAALLLGIGYMYLVLGPLPEATNLWDFFFGKIYLFGLVRIGLIIGSIVATLFILSDVFLIRKKQIFGTNKVLVRMLALSIILVVVATLHYLMEKTIDLI